MDIEIERGVVELDDDEMAEAVNIQEMGLDDLVRMGAEITDRDTYCGKATFTVEVDLEDFEPDPDKVGEMILEKLTEKGIGVSGRIEVEHDYDTMFRFEVV